MGSYRLHRAMIVGGQHVETVEDAAYALRQVVIRNYCEEGRELVHKLRHAATHLEALRAEESLQAWVSARPQDLSEHL